jgi:hypothetical protein
MSEEIKFVQGLFFNERKNAPDFVRAKMSISVDRFIEFAQENKNEKGYLNFDILEAKSGKDYAKVNDWKPTPRDEPSGSQAEPETVNDDLPF